MIKKPVLNIKLSDLFRATQAENSGNEGFIGIAPDCSQYHVVVPVDRQIARGLKFWIQPDDGTPFGGYTGWYYFCCMTYDDRQRQEDDHQAHLDRARKNGLLIKKWGEEQGFNIRLIDDMD